MAYDGQMSVKTTATTGKEWLAHWASNDIPLHNLTVHFQNETAPRRSKTDPPRFAHESETTSDADDHQMLEQCPDTDDDWESNGSMNDVNASFLAEDGQHRTADFEQNAKNQEFCDGTSLSGSAKTRQQVVFSGPHKTPPSKWCEAEDEDIGPSASGHGSMPGSIESLVPVHVPTCNAPTVSVPVSHKVMLWDAQTFDSKKKLVTERCDDWIVTVRAPVISHQKGQANFRASNGRGKIEVKSTHPCGLGECEVTAKVGEEPDETINHIFSPDTNIFKFPKEYDFRAAGEKKVRLVVSVRSISGVAVQQ